MTISSRFPKLSFGNVTAALPIVQGGMGIGISLSGLASAVAQAGGVGVIATAGIGFDEPDYKNNYEEANIRALRRHIQIAKEKTKGVLGVNIMVALTNYASMVRTAVEEKIDVIFSGAGLPLSLPQFCESASTKLVPIVSSGRAAGILCKKWLAKFKRVPDGFVVEGPKAGGHLGFKPEQIDDEAFSLNKLVQDVIEAVKPYEQTKGEAIPVIAAGGVYTGYDIGRYLEMGAAGVQMGTRFVATDECDADRRFKELYVAAEEKDLSIIKSPVGLPGRAIRNLFVRQMESGQKCPVTCPFHCLQTCDHTKSPYCISAALISASKGMMQKGLAFAGANAHRVKSIVPVPELIKSLKDELDSYLEKFFKSRQDEQSGNSPEAK